MLEKVEQSSLGILQPSFWPLENLRSILDSCLPPDAHVHASRRLGISLTHWPDGENRIITHFDSREEVIQALICTSYIPFYVGFIPPEFRGERYIDGVFSNNVPYSDLSNTITVSPFHGSVDICPQINSNNIHEFHIFQMCFQISSRNLHHGTFALIPPSLEVVADFGRQGYLDALRFLERRGLTKEPLLRSLVCDAPLAPAEGTPGAGANRDPKTGLIIDWTVPNVVVADVPNFQSLSPDLETELQKFCMRDQAPLARFYRSVPGHVLAYLMLPYTLPLQCAYFRTKRLVLWLPEMPSDLCWMQEQIRSATAHVYAWMKGRLFGPAK